MKRECVGSKATRGIIERLQTARWITAVGQRNRWKVAQDKLSLIEERLCALWPEWQQDVVFLRSLDLDPRQPSTVMALPTLRRARVSREYVHRKTWDAASAAGSKRRSRVPSAAHLTDDWSVRGRVSAACHLATQRGVVDLLRTTLERTEFSISQREWLRSGRFENELPHLVVTVENLGPFVDMPLPENTMLLFSQGAATVGAAELLAALPGKTWVHFGDLDPAGLHACEGIARLSGRDPSMFIPSFAAEYLDSSQPAPTRWTTAPTDPVLAWLSARQRWLEQEAFVLDPRLQDELDSLASRASAGLLSAG